MLRSFRTYNEKELTEDQIKLNSIEGWINSSFAYGYYEFDRNGIKSKDHTLPDSINQVLSDTIRSYKQNDIKIYIYKYI